MGLLNSILTPEWDELDVQDVNTHPTDGAVVRVLRTWSHLHEYRGKSLKDCVNALMEFRESYGHKENWRQFCLDGKIVHIPEVS